jgi:predicted dehydrogenase
MSEPVKGEAPAQGRRDFLKQAAAAAAFPMIVPSKVLGLGAHVAPSNRITMACIGTGSQGRSNLGQFLNLADGHFVAVCDVDARHRRQARQMINQANENQDCAEYNDFRELLERDDIDGVSIALPDHWHSIPSIACARKGWDIYGEKPLALTIDEGRAMCDSVHRHGTVWQTGSWQRSQSHFRHACELVRNGYIGEISKVEVGLPTGSSIEPQPVMEVPAHLDYDLWLGPAPWEPYTEKRCHWDFRWILDYSGGQLTDWAAHHVDIANWGMGTEFTGPVAVEGEGEFPSDGLWNAAINYMVRAEYAPGASPVAPNGFTMHVSNSFPMGARFYGTEGEVYVSRGDTIETTPETLKEIEIGHDKVKLYASSNHFQNFYDCVRSRALTVTPIEPAQRSITVAHLGNISMLLGRGIAWDPARERIPNDPQAQRMTSRPMRGPWHL